MIQLRFAAGRIVATFDRSVFVVIGLKLLPIHGKHRQRRVVFKAAGCNLAVGVRHQRTAAIPCPIPRIAAGQIHPVVVASGRNDFPPDATTGLGSTGGCMGSENDLGSL